MELRRCGLRVRLERNPASYVNASEAEGITNTNARRPIAAGTHAALWDAKDELDREVGSGVYLCRMVVEGGRWIETRKMVLIR